MVWKITKERTREETMKALGWNNMEDFLSDIIRFGMDKASDDPISFVQSRILEKFPILKEGMKEEEVKKNLERMYG